MRIRRSGISTLIGSLFFIIIVVMVGGSLSLMVNTFNGSVNQIHQSNDQAIQLQKSSVAIQNLTFGGEYFQNSTSVSGAANSGSQAIYPVSNMNFSSGLKGWTMSRSYSLLVDAANVTNSLQYLDLGNLSKLVPFTLTVTNGPSPPNPPLDFIARVTLLVDSGFQVPTPQPAPPNWAVAVTGNNITWTTTPAFSIPPGVSLPFSWLANTTAVGGVFYHTALISWYNVLNSRFVDTGIGTVNSVIESFASFPNPVPPASTATLTPAASGILPGGTLAGYDANALTTTSVSGPGSLYVNFQPTFNSLPLPRGQQLNSTVTFTTSFALDIKTTSELCASNGCGFSFGSSVDSLQSVRNPVVVYHVYLKNNVTGKVLSLPIGGRNPVAVNYTDPTLVNDFGPSGWVFDHVTFYPTIGGSTFWSAGGAGYYLIIKISMILPGASSKEAGYPSQVSMHFDDIGLALGLDSASYSGNGTVSMYTGLDYHLAQGLELGLNVTSFGNGPFNSATLYAYIADNSRPVFSPPLWVQFGSVTINSSGMIHSVFELPNAVYYLNSSSPTNGIINLRLAAISPYGNFSLRVSAFAVVRTMSQNLITVEVQNGDNSPIHIVSMYVVGPNGVGIYDSNSPPPNTLDRWVGGGQTIVIPEAYQWLPNQVYGVTITTNTGLIFSRTFTAPNVGLLNGACLNFAGLNLQFANFAGQNLACASFAGANLQHADFSHAILTGANFAGAHLQHANLTSVSAVGGNFAGVFMQQADLTNGNFMNSDFSNANLQGATTTGANFAGVIKNGCTGCP